jgi:hypothetical protein
VDSYTLIGYGGGGGGGNGGGGSAQAPDITGHPQSAAYTKDAAAAPLTVTAVSPDGGTLGYQWYKDDDTDRANGGETPAGTNSASCTAPTDDEGTFYYYVVVTNTLGGKSASAASAPAEITVTAPGIVNAQAPVISVQPQSTTYIQGASAAPLTVTASVSDAGTLHYQWYRNPVNSNYEGILIDGANGSLSSGAAGGNYTPPATDGGIFYYYVEVTNTITDNLDGGVKSRTNASAAAKITVSTLFPVTTIAQWNSALDTIRKSGNGTAAARKDYTIQVNGSFSVPGSTDTSTCFGSVQYLTVNLTGSGTVSLGSAGRNLLRLGNNQTLVIDGAGLTLKGRTDNSTSLVYLDSAGAALELRNGVITGNTLSIPANWECLGVGVYVGSGAFTMSGGKINGNGGGGHTNGGGVYVGSGTFTMSSGEISGNTAQGADYFEDGGGGVYIKSGTFSKSGNSVIYGYENSPQDNKAHNGYSTYGHAVYYIPYFGPFYCDTTLAAGDDISTSVLPTSSGPLYSVGNWIRK